MYHRTVIAVAGPEVRFLGAIYDKAALQSLQDQSYDCVVMDL